METDWRVWTTLADTSTIDRWNYAAVCAAFKFGYDVPTFPAEAIAPDSPPLNPALS